jgi:hypothetical protein
MQIRNKATGGTFEVSQQGYQQMLDNPSIKFDETFEIVNPPEVVTREQLPLLDVDPNEGETPKESVKKNK